MVFFHLKIIPHFFNYLIIFVNTDVWIKYGYTISEQMS